ncbi:hypothetical protein FKM82_011507 [Ascaphus truei]
MRPGEKESIIRFVNNKKCFLILLTSPVPQLKTKESRERNYTAKQEPAEQHSRTYLFPKAGFSIDKLTLIPLCGYMWVSFY